MEIPNGTADGVIPSFDQALFKVGVYDWRNGLVSMGCDGASVYTNSMLFGLPSYQIEKLQRVQNSAARLATRTKKSEHISPVLYDLHWLTVKNRIIFKILLIMFKALHGLAPGYLSDLITPYRPSRSLRSMVANLLILPKCRTKTYGERAFAVAGPTLWNSLPQFMRELTSVNQFKAHLKTYLFDK